MSSRAITRFRELLRAKVAAFRAKIGLFGTRIGRILGKTGRFLGLILDDLLVIAGLVVLVGTNFHVNELLGWYSLGVVLVVGGVLVAKMSGKRGKK